MKTCAAGGAAIFTGTSYARKVIVCVAVPRTPLCTTVGVLLLI